MLLTLFFILSYILTLLYLLLLNSSFLIESILFIVFAPMSLLKMKVQKNKNNNISEESKQSLRDFRQQQINSNIKLHKIFLIFTIIINIGLIFFIYFYKSKINNIKKVSNLYSNKIYSQDSQIFSKKNTLYKKMVNIASLGELGAFRFSLIFDKSEEFQNIKKIIYDYKKEKGEKVPNFEEIYTYFIYQGSTDSDEYSIFMNKLFYFEGITIMIETSEGKKFGIYHRGIINPDKKKKKVDSDCKDVFLFTLDSNKIYKFKGKSNSIHFNKKYLLSLGDDELVIYNEYFTNGGYIDFPLKSFDFSTVNSNILTGQNGKFGVKNVEVYIFFG